MEAVGGRLATDINECVDSCRLLLSVSFMELRLDLNKVQVAGSKVLIAGSVFSSPSWMLADPDAATRRFERMGNNFVWNWSCRLKA